MCPTPWDMPESHGNVPELTGHARAPRLCPTMPGWTHLLVFTEVAIQLVEVGGTLGGHGEEDG